MFKRSVWVQWNSTKYCWILSTVKVLYFISSLGACVEMDGTLKTFQPLHDCLLGFPYIRLQVWCRKLEKKNDYKLKIMLDSIASSWHINSHTESGPQPQKMFETFLCLFIHFYMGREHLMYSHHGMFSPRCVLTTVCSHHGVFSPRCVLTTVCSHYGVFSPRWMSGIDSSCGGTLPRNVVLKQPAGLTASMCSIYWVTLKVIFQSLTAP